MLDYSYIFVLSMPRSGSTLFRLLLGNVSGTVSLPETFFFVFHEKHKKYNISVESQRLQIIKNWIDYYTIRRMISDLSSLERELISGVKEFKDILNVTVKRYIYENELKNVKWVIEKSPPHIFFQPEIISMFSNSKAIYLLRDPRAVAGSMMNKSWATHNVYAIARSWKKSTNQFFRIKQSISVRYEDLVSKDINTYQKIISFFNSDININDFYTTSKEIDFKGVNKDYHTNLSSPIATKHVDKWKTQLSIIDKEQIIVEHICKRNMLKYNYELSANEKNILFYIILLMGYLKFLVSTLAKRIS